MLLCGGVFRLIAFMTIWNDRLSAPYWESFLLVGIAIGSVAAFFVARSERLKSATVAVFVIVSMVCGTMFVGIYVESRRSQIVEDFGADKEIQNSFFRSMHGASQDFQFFLHGAALKDCIPYAWSYRTMSFYQLHSRVAANVLPADWIELCQIKRG
jgi:hypothetical protein